MSGLLLWSATLNWHINLSNVMLTPLVRNIKLAYQSFEWISFCHILQELNGKADELSKEALSLTPGAFCIYEFIDGEEIEAMEFHFFY